MKAKQLCFEAIRIGVNAADPDTYSTMWLEEQTNDAIVEKVEKFGGDRLVELYNKWCVPVDPAILRVRTDRKSYVVTIKISREKEI